MVRTTLLGAVATAACALAITLAPVAALAQNEPGTVQLPLSRWRELADDPIARAASLGLASATVTIEEREGRIVAVAAISLSVRSRAAGEEALLLPPGTALVSATSDGDAISLARTANGLAWIADDAGEHRIEIRYEIEGARSASGASLALPLPPAPSVRLTATLPGAAGDGAIVPSVGARTTRTGDAVTIESTIPGGTMAHVAWRTTSALEAAVPSRATYRGTLGDDAVRFEVELAVDLASDAAVPIALFPTDVAVGEVSVDRQDAPIRVVDGHICAIVSGRGRHAITASIEIPLARDGGLPSARIAIPEVPVSRFELTLPEGKDVRVSPDAAIRRTHARGETLAVFHVPLTAEVTLSWPEALPEVDTTETEVRASTTLVHVLRAEEGVLRGRVHGAWEIGRGSASRFEIALPVGVDVGAVVADVATVADWRVGSDRVLTVFLDRAVSGPLALTIDFEVLIGSSSAPFSVPLLEARGVTRQRGMLALLATRDLVLQPVAEGDVARVGENQLPADVRAGIDATIAHVFRWSDAMPALQAEVATRPREQARYDARVDTLLSLGDVSTTASATIDVHVKSGTLGEIAIALPEGASLLSISAPSLREHRVADEDGRPVAHLFFTQEMEGQLRIELRYERIAPAGETDVAAPIAHLTGADVEEGRIAVEATAAVEVEARQAEGLSPIDLGELPEELVVRSTNPILLAFRYAHATPPPSLALSVARHAELAMRDAAIDHAAYRTLVTDDGLAVTTATWTVRNQRQQFLRVTLPAGAEIWSARVGGHAETPALASADEGAPPVILLGVLRSLEPFEVEITYATPVTRVGMLGRLSLALARPDVVATRARWEVYLPAVARWGDPSSDLALREGASLIAGTTPDVFADDGAGLTIEVPTEGVRYVFEDVYVGREGHAIEASFPYASGAGVALGHLVGLIGALLLWLGVLGLAMARMRVLMLPEGGPFELATYRFAAAARGVAVTRRGVAMLVATAVSGAALLVVALGWLGTSPLGPITSSLALGAGLALAMRRRIGVSLAALRARIAPPSPAPRPEPAPLAPAPETPPVGS